jgi:hypothetical protein
MILRRDAPMDLRTAMMIATMEFFIYSAWLTSIVFCAANGLRPLMIAAAAFFRLVLCR